MLATATSVRRFYQSLWHLENAAESPSCLNPDHPLPPFLCRRLAFGDPVVNLDCNWLEAMTGNSEATVEMIDAGGRCLHRCSNGISPRVFDILPIDGHRLAEPTHKRRDMLSQAFTQLASLEGTLSYVDTVADFTGLCLWVACDGPGEITSSSFPQLPHLTMISDRVLGVLLPNTHTESDSVWALAEDLVHEALHQQLSATILEHDVFTDDYEPGTGPRINIHWRDEVWPLDRAMHALYVYTGLVQLRGDALRGTVLNSDDRRLVDQALPQSRSAMAYLRNELPNHLRYFTNDGHSLLTLVCHAADALA